jgi:hypothetical protein
MLVGGIVVDDQVEIFFRRGALINHAQKLQPLLMAVAVVAHADHGAVESVQGALSPLPS